jgi:EamA domain-containing membrane protein RarD
MLVGLGVLFCKERISLVQLVWLVLAFIDVAANAAGKKESVEG